jgi:hypothetical protein
MVTLGLDIGGANLKFAIQDYGEIIYFPMWKKARDLENELRRISERFNPERVGVVITAELSDCFSCRNDGIIFVSDAVKKAFSSELFFMDIKGKLSKNIDEPKLFYASNWIASSEFLLMEGWRNFIFADMGSTTTDLIPITNRIKAARTDHERLKRGELLYFGILRTPIFYVLPKFDVPLTSEYFAITADAFIVTGDIGIKEYTCDTPDGREKSLKECMTRLARSVCLDADDEKYLTELAHAVKEKMVERVAEAMKELSEKHDIEKVVGCGIGEFILEKAAEMHELEYIPLSEHYKLAKLFPAYAIAKLVELE